MLHGVDGLLRAAQVQVVYAQARVDPVGLDTGIEGMLEYFHGALILACLFVGRRQVEVSAGIGGIESRGPVA